MLQEIHIAGHCKPTLPKLLAKRPGELDALVITNHDTPFPEFVSDKVRECLHLVFDDITHLGASYRHHILPTREHVEKALEWAGERPAIVVACHAGVSRSSALAYLIASRAWGPATALSVLRAYTHRPNPLVVKIGSDVLGEPEVWTRFVEWHNKTSCEDPSEAFWADYIQTDQEHINL